jgi:hypothetical protein
MPMLANVSGSSVHAAIEIQTHSLSQLNSMRSLPVHDTKALSSLETLEHLWLDSNRLGRWSSLVVLLRAGRRLKRLRVDNNPLTRENFSAMTARYLTIAHAPALEQVNGAQVRYIHCLSGPVLQ